MGSSGSHFTDARAVSVAALLRVLPGDVTSFRASTRALAAGDQSTLQWLFTEAGYHGVSGVIDPLLASADDLSPELRGQAMRRLAVEELWQAHMQSAMEHAAGVLGRASVPVCALKGPVLGTRLYAPHATRHCMDIDLLVAPDDFARASAALTAAGYVPEHGMSAEYLLRYGHHLGFSREGAPPLELHFRAYAGFGVTVPASLLLERAQVYRLANDVSVLVPSAADEFIYLAAHAAGHSFCRLVWLYDLKLLLQRAGPLDWSCVALRARSAGVLSAVAYATRLLSDWLGEDPGVLPRELSHRSLRSRIADQLLDEVSRPQQRSASENFRGLLFTSLLSDGPTSALWHFQHHMLRAARRRAYRSVPGLLPAQWNQ